MATVKVTINGVICDMYGRTISGPVKIVGEAMYTDVGVGGGPMPPGEGSPPGIWGGGNEPFPTPPIANVPGAPGYQPPRPAHPIVLPDPPVPPIDPPTEPPTNPPDPRWQWGYVYSLRAWQPVYVPGPTDPQPH